MQSQNRTYKPHITSCNGFLQQIDAALVNIQLSEKLAYF
jgi:hypothetical protein